MIPLDGDINPPLSSSLVNSKKLDLLDNLNNNKKSSTASTNDMFKQLKQSTNNIPKKDLVTNRSGTIQSETQMINIEVAPKLPPKPVREQVRVIYGYSAQNEDELTITEGDIITVISKDNEDVGWWKGELNGRIALFPDNFVEVIQPSPPPPLPRPADSEKLRIKKPDRSSPALMGVNATNSSTSTIPNTTTTINSKSNNTSASPSNESTSSNTFSSVPIIGKMIKFSQSNNQQQSTSSQSFNSVSTTNGSNKTASSEHNSDIADGEAMEDPFNATEPLSPSKLVHLTTQRPKIPNGQRRPPSLHLGKSTEFYEFMDSIEMDSSSPTESSQFLLKKSAAETKVAPGVVSLKPVIKQEPMESSPEKKAPWLNELKKNQEKRRTNELLNNSTEIINNRKSMNGLPPTTTSLKPHAPTPPLTKPFVSNSTKPSLVSSSNTASNLSTNNVIAPTIANNNGVDQHNVTSHESSTIPGIKPSAGASVTITNNNLTSTATTTTNINNNKNNIHDNATNNNNNITTTHTITTLPTLPSQTIQSGTNCGPILSIASNVNNNNKHEQQQSMVTSTLITTTDTTTKASLAACDAEMAKLRNEVNELTETVSMLRATVTELRRESAQHSASQKSQAEWTQLKAELEKQVSNNNSNSIIIL